MAYACVLRAYEHRRLMGLSGLLAVRACLERAVQEEPEYAEARAMPASCRSRRFARPAVIGS
ncbi:MAG TPA: hypothetical protein VF226_10900 [Hyphomicrobiaceae bacterium]